MASMADRPLIFQPRLRFIFLLACVTIYKRIGFSNVNNQQRENVSCILDFPRLSEFTKTTLYAGRRPLYNDHREGRIIVPGIVADH